MPDFWENDAVADSGADWWKADAVAPAAVPATTTATTESEPFVIPEDPRGRNPSAPNPAWDKLDIPGVTPAPDTTPSLSADTTSPVGRVWRSIRESLTPLIGPTESQLLRSENINPETGELRYKPLGGKIESFGLIPGSFQAGPKIPRIEQQEDPVAQQLAGTYNAVANLLEPMLSVGGVGTAGLGALGPVASRAAAAYFGTDMALHLKDAYRAVEEAKTPQEATTAILTLGGTVALIGKSAEVAVKGVRVPLETAAAKAEAAGAPATAEALKAQTIETKVAEPLIVEPEIKGSISAGAARIKEINALIKPFLDKGGLTAAEAERFRSLTAEANSLRFDLQKQLDVSKIPSPADRQSTLPSDIVLTARNDLMRSKEIYTPIVDAAVGVFHGADTPIDAIMRGENQAISARQLYDSFSATREAMRNHYGDTVKLFRATGKQGEKPTTNWATTSEYAANFGPNIVSRDVPISDVIAVNVGLSGKYHEVIIGKPPLGPISPPAAEVSQAVVEAAKPLRPLGELYSEPLSERIRRLGGPVANRVADESLQIINRAKRLYGDLSARVLDDAKQSAGKAFRGGTTWVQGIKPVTERAATSRFHDALEERVLTGNFDHVPVKFRPLVEKLWDANLEIGRLAQQANPQFVATGKAQRMLTAYGHDIVLRGRGRAWDAWAEGLAAANGKTVPDVKTFLRRWKAEMDKPGADAAGLDRISQDFVRQFPKVVTHVKPLLGWHEIVHSSPFGYLEQAAQRTANAVAFREVHPVGTGSVEATRTAVQAELQTDRHGAEFDNMMRALQGHPIDQFSAWWNAPDSPIGATVRATQIATKPIRATMLSSSLPTNIGESLSGGAQIFLGYGNVIRGAVKARTIYKDLERSGMVNEAIRDFSFDPTQPMRSISRYAGNMISRAFMNDFANEFQEYTGAATARLIADEVRAGTIDTGTKANLVNTMRAMGITKENAQAAADGKNVEVLNQFETKAAEFLSAGSQVTGEKSRFGASRAFNELFWFHSYPMSKVRQARSVLNNIIEDASTKDWNGAYRNATLLGKQLGGTALGGAITIGVLTLLREGLFGLDIKKTEAQDDFGDFTKEALLMGYGGPLQIANRIWENGGGIDDAASGLVMASAPLSLAKELSDAAAQSGRYEGMTAPETVGEFLQSKTPGLKPFKRGMAVWGLAQDDPEFDAAARAFYRWRTDKFGSTQYKAHLKEDKERKEFRGHMKQAVVALKDGDMDKFDARLDSAAEVAESGRSIKQSFDSRKLLRSPSGKKLTEEELDELRERIGEKAVDKLLGFDAMLESLSR